jgi:Flp pilus assembly protein TadD
MPLPKRLLEDGITHHQAGRHAEAEAAYQAAHEAAPDQAEPLRLLGILAHHRQRHAASVKFFFEACRRCPQDASCRADLGIATAAAGHLPAAVECLRQAVALSPNDALCRTNLAQLLLRRGPVSETAPIAEHHLREAIRLQPNLAEAHSALGAALREQKRLDEAVAALQLARQLDPRSAKAVNNLGNVLGDLGALAEAEAAYHEAVALDAKLPEPYNNLGHLYRRQNRLSEAEANLREALRLSPDCIDALINFGNVLTDLGQYEAAEERYCQALALQPDHPDARYDLGALQLLTGRLEQGWAGYEARWQRRGFAARPMAAPAWQGEPLAGRTLLLHAEQGYGDTVQFCRFIPQLAQEGPVILEAPAPLLPLLATLQGGISLVAAGDPLPPHDVQLALPSLTARRAVTLADLPGQVPYLHADPAKRAAWRHRLAALPGLHVGIAWAGNVDYALDSRRSIDPALLAPLFDLPSVTFVSLQKNAPTPASWRVQNWTDELVDFAETAALIDSLDLVISVDTAIIHLAGALARPAWLLNRFDSCWRWLLQRADSPWYPTVRIFRQSSPLDWVPVLAEITARLTDLARGSGLDAALPARFPAGLTAISAAGEAFGSDEPAASVRYNAA